MHDDLDYVVKCVILNLSKYRHVKHIDVWSNGCVAFRQAQYETLFIFNYTMNQFEKALLKYFSEVELNKIQSVKIGIAGAGGLGSNCALNLVRSGFKKLKIIDFDRIEFSNLNRQFFFFNQVGEEKVSALLQNLKAINSDVEIKAIVDKLDEDNLESYFTDCQIIIEALDKAEIKSLLVEKLLPYKQLIVSASGIAGYGNSNAIKINQIKENLVLVGDLKSEVSEQKRAYAPKVALVAAKQADVVLEYVLRH